MWYYLNVEIEKAETISSNIQEAFFALLLVAPNSEAAVFSRYDAETIGTNFYFTPGTERIAKVYGATLCEKPLREEAGTLLCGEQPVIDRLFR